MTGYRSRIPVGRRDLDPDLLPLAPEVRWADAVGDEAAASARGREHAAEAAGGELEPRQGNAARRYSKKNVKPGRARQLVDYLCQSYRISVRRACRAYPLDRSTYHYRSRRPDQAALRQRIREIADTRVRYGYRRVHVLLLREGWAINHKRSRRLYRKRS